MRKAGVAAAVVVPILVILVLLLPRLVSLDSLRPRIVAALEEKTGRTVGLSGLSLSLFPGIGVRVERLTVSGDPRHPGERLLSVPAAEIRLAIAPLLSGRAEFTKFILRRPEIRFRRYLDGTHSVTDIVTRLAGGAGGERRGGETHISPRGKRRQGTTVGDLPVHPPFVRDRGEAERLRTQDPDRGDGTGGGFVHRTPGQGAGSRERRAAPRHPRGGNSFRAEGGGGREDLRLAGTRPGRPCDLVSGDRTGQGSGNA